MLCRWAITNDKARGYKDELNRNHEAKAIKERNRGFIVETKFTPCRCYDKPKYMVFADNEVDLDLFHWTTEHEGKVVSFFDRDGMCPTCKEDIKFDQHFVGTHQEEVSE